MTLIHKRLKCESGLRREQAGYEVSIAVAGTMTQKHAFANVSFPILCLYQVVSAVCPITTEAVSLGTWMLLPLSLQLLLQPPRG